MGFPPLLACSSIAFFSDDVQDKVLPSLSLRWDYTQLLPQTQVVTVVYGRAMEMKWSCSVTG